MNKHCFRLIFSKVQGFLIPVAEIATAARKPGQDGGKSATESAMPCPPPGAPKLLAAVLFCLRSRWLPMHVVSGRGAARTVLATALLPGFVLADMLVDPAAPASQRPGLTTSANGVPVIEISAPNSGGLSHNTFSQFDVSRPGVIYNNNLEDGVSLIGGFVAHNPKLATEAKAILTEVTGNAASNLSGTLEVFGGKADLLIANANGVTLNGVTTLNANNLTVTTGRVVPGSGGAVSFSVSPQSGRVVIGADGVDAAGLNYFDVVARSIALNGAINGPSTEIKLLAGLNNYDPATRSHSVNATSGASTPALAIEGSLMGAMYGKHIALISTESGVGVRHAGLVRSALDIQVSADGDIRLASLAADNGDIRVSSQSGDVSIVSTNSTDRVQASGLVEMSAKGFMTITQDMLGGRLALVAEDLLVRAARLVASGRAADQARGLKGISIEVGRFTLSGDFQLLDNRGSALGAGYSLQTINGKLAVVSPTGVPIFEDLWSGNYKLGSTAVLSSNTGLSIKARERVDNAGGLILNSGAEELSIITKQLENSGWINSTGSLRVAVEVLNNLCAPATPTRGLLCVGLRSAADLQVTAGQLNNDAALSAGNDLTLRLTQDGVASNQGSIAAKKNLDIAQAAGVKARLVGGGELVSGEDLLVALHSLSLLQGTTILPKQGKLLAGGDIQLSVSEQLDIDGAVDAGRSVEISAADILNGEHASLTSRGGLYMAASGTLSNAKGSNLAAGTALRLEAQGDLSNAATLNAERIELVSQAHLRNHGGADLSGSSVQLNGGSITNTDIKIFGSDRVSMIASSGDLTNTGAANEIVAGSTVELTAKGAVINSAGSQVYGSERVTASGASLRNEGANSRLTSDKTVALNVRGDLSNTAGASITGTEKVQINGGRLHNDAASISGATVQMDGESLRNSNQGQIQANNIAIKLSGELHNESASFIKAAVNASLIAGGAASNNGATLEAGQALRVQAGSLVNSAAGKITADRLNVGSAAELANIEGALMQGRNVEVKAAGVLSNDAAAIKADETLLLEAGTLANRNAGVIRGKDVSVQVSGDFSNTSKASLTAERALSVTATGDALNDDAVIKAQTVSLSASDLLNRNGGNILGDDLTLLAQRNFTNTTNGVIKAEAGLDVTAVGDPLDLTTGVLRNSGGATLSAKDMSLSGRRLYNDASILGERIQALVSEQFRNALSGTIKGEESVVIAAEDFSNEASASIQAGETLDISTGTYSNRGTLASKKNATLTITQGRDLDINTDAGRIAPVANELLTLNARHVTVTSGGSSDTRLENPGSIRINATGHVLNDGQAIITGKSLKVYAVDYIRNGADALIWAKDNVLLQSATDIYNDASALLLAGYDMALSAGQTINNYVARISAGNDLTLTAQTFTNEGRKSGGVNAGANESNSTPVEYKWYHTARNTSIWFAPGNIVIPTYTSNLTVKQAVLESGRDMTIKANVVNKGSQVLAGRDMAIIGNVDNQAFIEKKSLLEILRGGRFRLNAKDSLSPSVRESTYDWFGILDAVLGTGNDWNEIFGALGISLGYHDEDTLNALKLIDIPFYSQVMSAVLGAEWKALDRNTLVGRWNAFKAVSDTAGITFYADKAAEIASARDFKHTGGYLKNGDGALQHQRTVSVRVGDETINTIAGDFDSSFNFSSIYNINGNFNFKDLVDAFNPPGSLQDLLKNRHLFQRQPNPPALDLSPVDKVNLPAGGAVVTLPKIYPLYETRIQYIDQSQFYGSEYFFKSVNYSTNRTVPVLGDAYFEHQLILRTAQNVAGSFFASTKGLSGDTLVKSLMDNAAREASRLGLVMGTALTEAQWRNLDADIVWYEPQLVDGMTVLAPRLYLAESTIRAMAGEAAVGAKIVAGGKVNVAADAGGVDNVNGLIRGAGGTTINSAGAINNIATGGSAGAIAAGSGASVVLDAKGGITNQGATIVGENVSVKAGGDINVATGTTYDEDGNLVSRGNGGIVSSGSGSVSLDAGNDINLKGASIGAAENNLSLKSGGNLNIEDVHSVESSFSHKATGNLLGNSQTTDFGVSATSEGSLIQGKHLTLDVGGNMTVTGSTIDAQNTSGSVAGGLTTVAGKNLSYAEQHKSSEQLMFGAGVSGGGYHANAEYGGGTGASTDTGRNADGMAMSNAGGVTAQWGYQKSTSKTTQKDVTYDNAQLNLGSGSLVVGGTFDIGGADINAANDKSNADLAITAGDIKDTQFEEIRKTTSESSETFFGYKYEGHSSIVNVSNELGKMGSKAAQDGMSVEGGMTTAQVAGEVTQLLFDDTIGGSATQGVDHSMQNSSREIRSEKINKLGGNLSLTTTKGDLTLTGVESLGRSANLTLDSAGDVNLGAAKTTTVSSAESQSHSVGVSSGGACTAALASCGGGVQVSYDGSLDKTGSKNVDYTNTDLSGNITIKSKGDTKLVGANVGGTVNTDIGGNLNVESVQNTQEKLHEQGGWGVSGGLSVAVVAGIPVATPNGGAHAEGGRDYDNYKLTGKQSGITTTGDSTIKVAGDVNLIGGKLVSEGADKATLEVGGAIKAKTLTDTREKDGWYGGAGGGIGLDGLPGVSVQFGRVNQVHYEADNLATIDMDIVSKNKAAGGVPQINGSLNTDAGKTLDKKKDEKVAGNDVKFVLSAPKVPKKKVAPGGDDIVLPLRQTDPPVDHIVKVSDVPPILGDSYVPGSIKLEEGEKRYPPKVKTDPVQPSKPPVKRLPSDNTRYMSAVQVKEVQGGLAKINRMSDAELKRNPVEITVKTPGGNVETVTVRSRKDVLKLDGVTVYDSARRELFPLAKGQGLGKGTKLVLEIKDYGNGSFGVRSKTR